jgi:Protein of unknown function (DUF2034)
MFDRTKGAGNQESTVLHSQHHHPCQPLHRLSSLTMPTKTHSNLGVASHAGIFDDLPSSNVQRKTSIIAQKSFAMHPLHTLNQHFSMNLRRVGGKDDGDVDLVGWWWVPDAHRGEGKREGESQLGSGGESSDTATRRR